MRHNYKILSVAGGATAAATLTAEFDTKGFSYASIAFVDGTAPTTHTISTVVTANVVQHSDSSGSGHANITGYVSGTDFTVTTTAISTAVAKIVYNIDLRGKKRYLKVTASPHGAMTTGAIVCTLTNPADGCVTAAEVNSAIVVNGQS